MTTGNRMKVRRKEIGVPVDEIAAALGVSVATIYRYENGEIEKVPGSVLEPLANVLHTTPAYLMGWEEQSQNAPTNLIPLPVTYKVPLIGTIACGKPILALEDADEMVNVPDFIRADFALRCKGDSMINARIFDGDVVYIRKQPEVERGQIAAVRIGDEATLKRVSVYPDKIVLEAANPMYDPLIYRGEEMNQVEILGKAVAFTSTIS